MSVHDSGEGHGHVVPRPDGLVYDCGGPDRCPLCAAELAEQQARLAAVELRRRERAAKARAPQQHERRIRLRSPRHPRTGPLEWVVSCRCGWSTDPRPHDLGADSAPVREALALEWAEHAATADAPETAEDALARWTEEMQ